MILAKSLKKILAVLVLLVCILIVFYYKQNISKPASFISTFQKSVNNSKNKPDFYTIPTEKTWTYKCESDRCVRYHYNTELLDGKRIPYMTCSMTCGDINIWPHPTIKTAVSSKSLRFTTTNVELKIDTKFNSVKNVFLGAFELFLNDLKIIEKYNYNTDDNNDIFNDDIKLQKINPIIKINLVKKNDEYSFLNKDKKLNCDIDNLLIVVSIIKSDNIYLNFDTDESYNITTNYEKRKLIVKITANSYFGARHGLSTVQQLIWFDDADNLLRIISKLVIFDAPKFKYRGLMLDTSRNYFSVESIKRTLTGMSHTKLNRFHWHITDTQSFPFVSKYYPELAAHGAYSEEETYTSDDVREIVAYAQLRGIQVVPEIDAPAHAGNGWDWGPKKGLGELSLCINQQPWSFYCGEPPCGQLNPKNRNVYLILQKLYEELLNLTGPTDYFHIGGDEVNFECWNQYFNDTDLRSLWCDFMLESLDRLKIANNNKPIKYVSVWSSALTNSRCLSKSQFIVQVWGGSTWVENYDLLDNGFNLIFSHVDAWYLDCGFGSWRQTGAAACSPYRTWQNVYKHRPWEKMQIDKTKKKKILGGEACLWTEQVDEASLDSRLWPRAAALGERLWTDPDNEHDAEVVSREVFARIAVLRNRMVEIGIKAEPLFPKYCQQNPGECI